MKNEGPREKATRASAPRRMSIPTQYLPQRRVDLGEERKLSVTRYYRMEKKGSRERGKRAFAFRARRISLTSGAEGSVNDQRESSKTGGSLSRYVTFEKSANLGFVKMQKLSRA